MILIGLFVLGVQLHGATAGCSDEQKRVASLWAAPSRYSVYREDTFKSIEMMRDPTTGLVRDKIQILPHGDGAPLTTRVLNANTSGTNIGLDLINQIGAIGREGSRARIEQIMTTLERLPFHHDSGLFFSWYSTDASLLAVSRDVSSVDNIHMALALWTLQQLEPGTALALRAEKLLHRMDFSIFYDHATGLMAGNLKYKAGTWTKEAYRFDGVGSEARSIYALTYALDLLKSSPDLKFAQKAVGSLNAEFFQWKHDGVVDPILKTWDGGTFQLMLPALLINEEKYSPMLAESFRNYADYIRAEGAKAGLPVPAAYSASNYGLDLGGGFKHVPAYNGQAGSPALVESRHMDVRDPKERALWDEVFTPHAAMMAATAEPATFAPALAKAESLRSGGVSLYEPGRGFMDGYHVKGEYQGQVVPVQLSLDQGMIELSIDKMQSADGLTASGRALMKNKTVRDRLRSFYGLLDQKLRGLWKGAESGKP